MDTEQDRRLLEQLRLQLEESDADDAEVRERLRNLGGEVARVMAPMPKDRAAQLRSLRSRLQDEVKRVESSHPDLTATMAQVIDQLAMWGI